MSKKQANLSQENQDTKYPDAKPAQKAEHYEDFTVLAERLRKEGRLGEGNYKKLRRRFWIINSFLVALMLLPIALTMGKNNDFLFFLLFGCLGIWGVIRYRLDLNRYCYLFSLGEVAKGEIIETIKREKYKSYIYYLMSFDIKTLSLCKDAMYNHLVKFSFNELYPFFKQPLPLKLTTEISHNF